MCSSQRWWSQSRDLCPVCGFPICLLPYPPFRLHSEANPQPVPDLYVDGKFLALKLVAQGLFTVSGRMLDGEILSNLESYLRRFKLGTMQLGRALALAGMLGSLDPETGQHRAGMHELFEIRVWAKRRLKALRWKQSNRLCRLSAPERQNAREVLNTLEDEPGQGAQSNNRVTRPSTATWSERPASFANSRGFDTVCVCGAPSLSSKWARTGQCVHRNQSSCSTQRILGVVLPHSHSSIYGALL